MLSGEAINMLEQLHKHPEILLMLAKFVYHYVGASSIEDYGDMIGEMVPYIVLALFGGAVGLIADDTAIAGLIAKLASKEGTIARLEVYAKDEIVIAKDEEKLETIKTTKPIINRSLDELKAIVQEKIPKEWGEGIPNSKGVGWRWFGENPLSDGVRIDQGDPEAKYAEQRVDHMIIRSKGRVIGRYKTPLEKSIFDDPVNAHVPVEDWLQWESWDK